MSRSICTTNRFLLTLIFAALLCQSIYRVKANAAEKRNGSTGDICQRLQSYPELSLKTNPDLSSPKTGYVQFSPAVKNFIAGNYQRSFEDYYASYLCPQYGGVYSGINPVVQDAGLQFRFAEAMQEAADNRLFVAENNMRSIVVELPTFGEARLMIGNLAWALGQKTAARETWKQTVKSPYFTMPPDQDLLPIPVSIAKDLLRIMER